MDIVVYNILFWTAWFCVSSIPYFLTQYTIDNFEKVQEWQRRLS